MRFRILGPLEVQVDGSWIGLNAPKWRTVLAVLLLRAGQVVSTDQLISEVWLDDAPARATNLISVYVHRLRRLIGDPGGKVLVTHSPGYQLLVTADDIDYRRFARLAADGRKALFTSDCQRAADLLSEALGLWRGSRALADVPASDLVSAEASGLEEARVEALELRIQADLACGRQAEVVAELRRLLADHPIREGMWALLMRALFRSGRQAEALEAYSQAREVIGEELGVDPGAELQHLYQQILAADAGAAPGNEAAEAGPDSPFATLTAAGSPAPAQSPDAAAPPSTAPAEPLLAVAQLPADIADFTGRAGQVTNLCELLTAPRRSDSPGAVVLAAVIGAGGLGKTTLAVHAAHLLRDDFPDGQLYANLVGAGHRPVASAEILARFLRDLGADPARIPVGEEERAAQYRSRLAGRRVLIVLDDARDAEQVRSLLPGSASCAVLVTSRSRMPELAGSRFVDLDVLELAEARALFTAIVGPERAEAEPTATDRVLTACAGLPLAIRIAGARLAARGNWTVAAMADRLSDERRRLDELKTGNLAVRACFEVSFSSLPGADHPDAVDPAHAFRMLGVWQGTSIELPAAAALLGQPQASVADALEVLVDAQLLQSPAPDRYQFHDLLKAYAADRADAEEPAAAKDEAVRQILDWYLHTADAVAQMVSPQRYRIPLAPSGPELRPLSFGAVEQALEWCETERLNLIAATRQAADCGMRDIAWQLPVELVSFFNRRGYWSDWIATHHVALTAVRQLGDHQGEAWVLNNLGMAFARQRMADAVGYFEQALAIRRDLGDQQGEAQVANNLADTYLLLGRSADAVGPLERSLVLLRKVGDAYGEGVALNNLGEAYLDLGRVEEATACLEQALERFRTVGVVRGEGYTLHNLGKASLDRGHPAAARECLHQALAIHHAAGDRYGEALTLKYLGDTERAARQWDDARVSWTRARAIFEELGDEGQIAELSSRLEAPGAGAI